MSDEADDMANEAQEAADLMRLAKIFKREPVPAKKRKPLTRREFAELMLSQNGKCGNCGLRLVSHEIIDEHIVALALGGGNELTNRSLWCKPCSQKKTDEHDKPLAAKGARLRGETGQGPKRKIESRPFSKAYAVESRSPSQWQGMGVSTLSKNHPRYVKRKIGR